MILEVIRIVADWYGHATYGVNAKLTSLPYDAGDSAPQAISAILDTTRSNAAAQGETGPDWPVLIVTSEAPADAAGEIGQTNRDSTNVSITTRIVTNDPDSANASRDTLYTLRAIVQSHRELMRNTNEATRTRNNICLWICTGIQFGEVREKIEGGTVTGAVVATFKVRDSAP